MNVVAYALMAYGITAVISLLIVGIIVIIGRVMGGSTEEEETEDA